MIKNNDLRNEILVMNQKISEQNKTIYDIQNEINEKNEFYLTSIETEKQKYNKKLEETVKQNIKSELALKTKIKEIESQTKNQKTKSSSRDRKEKELIEELRFKLQELEKFK